MLVSNCVKEFLGVDSEPIDIGKMELIASLQPNFVKTGEELSPKALTAEDNDPIG